jgi:hypothetical protein
MERKPGVFPDFSVPPLFGRMPGMLWLFPYDAKAMGYTGCRIHMLLPWVCLLSIWHSNQRVYPLGLVADEEKRGPQWKLNKNKLDGDFGSCG